MARIACQLLTITADDFPLSDAHVSDVARTPATSLKPMDLDSDTTINKLLPPRITGELVVSGCFANFPTDSEDGLQGCLVIRRRLALINCRTTLGRTL